MHRKLFKRLSDELEHLVRLVAVLQELNYEHKKMRNPFYVPDSSVSTDRRHRLEQSVPIGYIINEDDLINGKSGMKVFKKNNDLTGVGEIAEHEEADETDLMADYLA